MPAKSEMKMGFWVGLGVAVAFLVMTFIQLLVLRTVRAGYDHGG